MAGVRTYTLPSTADEKRTLIDELCVMTTRVLGYPTRQANITRWWQMPVSELRKINEKWRALDERTKQKQGGARQDGLSLRQ
jgi:hypothetical protein